MVTKTSYFVNIISYVLLNNGTILFYGFKKHFKEDLQMKKLKSMGLVLLVVMLVAAFAACGSDDAKTSETPSPLNSEEVSESPAVAESEEPAVSPEENAEPSDEVSESPAAAETPDVEASAEVPEDAGPAASPTESAE